MFDDEDKVQKRKIEVEVKLNDGTDLMGALFVHAQQRLSDLLNDQRQFLPLLTSGGMIVNLAKSWIAQVVQLDQRTDLDETDDPFEILGVTPTERSSFAVRSISKWSTPTQKWWILGGESMS